MRRLVPITVLPLALLASVLAATPWLRSFPVDVAGGPLLGAALLSVLLPIALAKTGVRPLWLTALIDLAIFVLYGLIVVLHDPSQFGTLLSGLYRGPSQLLTFALPLVSPRSLMAAPVALTWLAGAVAGECLARRWWSTPLPYLALLICFGLAYAATVRGAVSGAVTATNVLQRREVIFAALLLGVLLLLRAAVSWLRQDADAESTQPDGILPLRGLAAGLVVAALVSVVAAVIVRTTTSSAAPALPQRVPSVNSSAPVSPLSFVAGLRPVDPSATGVPLFTVRTDAASPGYVDIANLDFYDGSGWSFDRTFRPSGGVLPADPDTTLAGNNKTVTQSYQIDAGPLTNAPWMPFVYRPQKVNGVGVNADPDSGMIVPTHPLSSATTYTVTSSVPSKTFASVPSTATPDTLTSAIDVQLPGTLSATLQKVISTFSTETGVSSTPAVPFLLALQRDLQTNYSLPGDSTTSPSTAPAASKTRAAPSASPSPSPSAAITTAPPGARAGSTSFADVAASILGSGRTGTPEQYATLVALVARQLGVPARVATGFRLPLTNGSTPAGSYVVTTADAWSWVEIPVIGQGWMVLDAAPGRYGSAPAQPTEGATTSPLPTVTPTANSVIAPGQGGHAVAPRSKVPSHTNAGHLTLLLIVIVVALLVVAVLVLLALRKPLRTRRRRAAPDPRTRILGAWAESIDLLSEAGLPELESLTNTEIAQLAKDRFGPTPGEAAGFLGGQATLVVYSPRTVIVGSDAEEAWEAHDVLRTEVRRSLRLRDRLTAWLRYHR